MRKINAADADARINHTVEGVIDSPTWNNLYDVVAAVCSAYGDPEVCDIKILGDNRYELWVAFEDDTDDVAARITMVGGEVRVEASHNGASFADHLREEAAEAAARRR